eukprot:gene10441-2963_t
MREGRKKNSNTEDQKESLILKEKTKIPFFCNECFVLSSSIFFFALLAAGSLNFIVIGDFGYFGKGNQTKTAQAIAEFCTKNKCDFLISTGDNFYPSGVSSTNDSHWIQSFENVYNNESIKHLPFFSILGNRDYRQNVESQIEYTYLKGNSRWKMLDHYFSFQKSVPNFINPLKLNFLTLDTTPFFSLYKNQNDMNQTALSQQNNQTQTAWFKKQLNEIAKKNEWNFVLGHHPIYQNTKDGKDFTVELRNQINPILESKKFHAYFAGHQHCLRAMKDNNTVHIISGAAGNDVFKPNPHPKETFLAVEPGFVFVQVKFNFMTIDFYSSFNNETLKHIEINK